MSLDITVVDARPGRTDPGGSSVGGTAAAILLDGPADGHAMTLPAHQGVPCQRLQLRVAGRPSVYLRIPPLHRGRPWRYIWDRDQETRVEA
jgi:hypothetical protein